MNEGAKMVDRPSPVRLSGGPRVLSVGWFGGGSRGNDATLAAFDAAVRRRWPNVDHRVLAIQPGVLVDQLDVEAEAWFAPEKDVRTARWLRAVHLPFEQMGRVQRDVARARDVDLVVVPGTGPFEGDFGSSARGMLAGLARLGIATRLSGAPLAYVGVGVSNFRRRDTSLLVRGILSLSQYRSYRDEQSRAASKALGVDVRQDLAGTDLVWADKPLDRAPTSVAGPPRVVIAPMRYHDKGDGPAYASDVQQRHEATFVDAADHLIRSRGAIVDLVAGDSEDIETADRVRAGLARRGHPLPGWTPQSSYRAVREAAASSDLVVAARYHTVVAGLQHGTPTIALAYGPKFRALAAAFGPAAAVAPVETVDGGWLTSAMDRLLDAPTRERIELGAGSHADRARIMLDDFFAWSEQQPWRTHRGAVRG